MVSRISEPPTVLPSWELTYSLRRHFWRWFSFSPGGICDHSLESITFFFRPQNDSTTGLAKSPEATPVGTRRGCEEAAGLAAAFMTPTEGSNLCALEKVTCIPKKRTASLHLKKWEVLEYVLSFLGWLVFRGYVSLRECKPPPKGKEKIVFQSHHFFRGEFSNFRGSMFFKIDLLGSGRYKLNKSFLKHSFGTVVMSYGSLLFSCFYWGFPCC